MINYTKVFYHTGYSSGETEMTLIQISKQHNITFMTSGTYSGSGVAYFEYSAELSEQNHWPHIKLVFQNYDSLQIHYCTEQHY